jgi:hypothetical protein
MEVFGMLSSEGINNLNLLKEMIFNTWGNNVVLLNERIMQIPVDAFEFQMQLYGSKKVLLEYETGTFALKLWTGERFEYLDKFVNDKIIYGFDSMIPENIQHNIYVLDKLLNQITQ